MGLKSDNFSRYKVRRQILNCVERFAWFEIWGVVHEYNQPDMDFFRQVFENWNFQDVSVFKMHGTPCRLAVQLDNNQILYIRQVMSQRDWRKIGYEKHAELAELNSKVYYGLFVDDTNVLLSVETPPSLKIYDTTSTKANCVLPFHLAFVTQGIAYAERFRVF